MRALGFWFPALPALLVVLGCASADEWATWRAHPSHFASGSHLVFSARHGGAAPATRVTRNDVVLARDQAWWGKPVTVDQAQIIER
jgi:hypothetical protein